MLTKKLSHLIRDLDEDALNYQDVTVTGIVSNSSEASAGCLFVAIEGTKLDGHSFCEDAIKRGAVAIVASKKVNLEATVPVILTKDSRTAYSKLCSRFFEHPSHKMNVIGVTGTNGKTTTSLLIKSILESATEKVALMGTIFTFDGLSRTDAKLTTPDPTFLHNFLYRAYKNGCRSCVMEASSHSLDQRRVEDIKFAAAVFTNLSQDHLDYHKTMNAYRNAKARLFKLVKSNSVVALNADDDASQYMESVTSGKIAWYGLKTGCCSSRIIKLDIHGSRFAIQFDNGEELEIKSKLIGLHNVYNSLAASAVCYKMGYNLESIKQGIEKTLCVTGRLERVDSGQDFAVFVDYAHTPEALRNALLSLKPLCKGSLITVFGCGGDRDKLKRPLMGQVVEELSEFFLITSDNPRSEEPREIIREIEKGIKNKSKYVACEDRAQAIRQAIMMAKEGDIVLIAGKGHEYYQILNDRVVDFDDKIVAREALKEKALLEVKK